MTDTIDYTVDEENDSQVLQWYKRSMSEIKDIDELLDAGSDAATKRKFTSERVSQFEVNWKPVFEKLDPQLDAMIENGEFDKLVGAYTGLIRALQSKFSKPIEQYVTEQVEAQPKSEDTLTDDQKKELGVTRSELAKKVKTLVDMAGNFGEYEPDNPWALPKRRGAVGKRGPRALSLYTWTVDGNSLPDDDDNQSGVAEAVGLGKSSALTAALKEIDVEGKDGKTVKFDTTNPPDQFTVEVNGHTITGARLSEEEEEVEQTGVTDEV